MPYLLTQILVQLPLLVFTSPLAYALLVPDSGAPRGVVVALCFTAAPALGAASLFAHRRINRSFGLAAPVQTPPCRAIVFGVSLAFAALSALIAMLAAIGAVSLSPERFDPFSVAIGFGVAALTAPIEEVLFRGALQRKLEARWGRLVAIVVSGLLFAAAHAPNPGATPARLVVLAAFGMLLLGVTYSITKSLAACVAAHFTWNFLLLGVLGGTTSGIASKGVLVVDANARALLNGGDFGLEASLLSPIATALALLALCKWVKRSRLPTP